MAANMKAVKLRIKSVQSTMQITKAMELVASSKLRKAKERAEVCRPYFETMHQTLVDIAQGNTDFSSVYARESGNEKRCYVLIAGDRGLAGGYNTNLFKCLEAASVNQDFLVLPIGKKAVEYSKRNGFACVTESFGEIADVSVADCFEMANLLCGEFKKGEFGHILTYRGGKGLRGAMDAWGEGVREIEVEDPGVLLDTNTKMDYESLLAYEKDRQKRGELAFQATISLSREEECFSALTADFLEAVAESGSMLGACQIRDISYSKGWKMLKIAEAQLGIQFLERQTGGSKGGFSVLTPEGKAFLEKFRRMETAVQAAAEAAFEKIFLEPEEEEKEDTDGREINAF